ncbi:hypothetical protein [Pleurocapsa sp. FMAR1]|uniref:hypothetical protein n=1 Tax=Pleurocapsa sp. FMAR1 TaxID=3040204 RepID=UPI0029C6EFA9|nr:hypothetical protein [Pleurocapsa sp. FMAR1]
MAVIKAQKIEADLIYDRFSWDVNSDILTVAKDEVALVTHPKSPSLFENNLFFHKFLIDGRDMQYQA